ncbi:MFS general substrate transporter [Trichoderma longibrachiatum]|uniref:MFS general substrate transporter n=1 Tax=Trichoderma longibrachiatum ATCC 18648 TaxID=983965 RepID=A0A2T4C057_TRILO|nr:MFS general substrate transporter [Trichoderma longibrachiatum ATCC 18648]
MDKTFRSEKEGNTSRPPTSGTQNAMSLETSKEIVASESPSIGSGSHRTAYFIRQDAGASGNDAKPRNSAFRMSSLWQRAEVNPLNGKSFTFPLFRIWDIYSTAFWLATLGFFVAFFSWFAFSPLVPEAVKADLNLTQDQVTNSNLASLGGTAIVRLIAGPACDRFGPRKVLAALLVLGAIPSGLAALVTNIQGLEAVRFFISILGGTFVPTQAYTTTFFDKSIVGTANAFSGGWGNLGGGVTVAVMIGLYQRYIKAGFSPHLAWRLCFVTVPVPCLLLVAVIILLFGRDHPRGKWSQRHRVSSMAKAKAQGIDRGAAHQPEHMLVDPQDASAREPADSTTSDTESGKESSPSPVVEVDTAQSEPLTFAALLKILADLRVWSCALCYLLTFGLETAMDAALPGLINTLFASESFTITDAAYAASTYGLMNLFARPLGGIMSDLLYARFGLRAKMYWLLVTALSQGIVMIGLGVYINRDNATIGGVIGFIVAIAITGFAANGACYSIYGHLRPKNIGAVAGVVGAAGNIGGLFYTLIFKYQPGVRHPPSPSHPHGYNSLGKKFWVAGLFNAAAVAPLFLVPLGDAV